MVKEPRRAAGQKAGQKPKAIEKASGALYISMEDNRDNMYLKDTYAAGEIEDKYKAQMEAEKQEEQRRKEKRENTIEWIKDIIIAIIIAVVIMQFVRPTIVRQSSMEPNFYEGHYLLLSKQAYGLFGHEPEYGQIVVFESELADENGNEKLLIKRVIGKPGDTIRLKDGWVYRNGVKIDEPYIHMQGESWSPYGTDQTYTVPEGEYFLMGDHREVSVDSRYDEVGTVALDQFEGRVFLRLYPFNQIESYK